MLSTDAISLADLATLPDDVGVLKQVIAQLCEALDQERAAHRELRENFDLFLKRFWGPKSEKVSPDQLPLFDKSLDPNLAALLAPPAAETATPKEEAPARRHKGAHGRRRVPDTLELKVVVQDLTDVEKMLLGGEAGLRPLEDQVTTQFEWKPSSLIVLEHRQKKYVRIDPSSGPAVQDAEAAAATVEIIAGADQAAADEFPPSASAESVDLPLARAAQDTVAVGSDAPAASESPAASVAPAAAEAPATAVEAGEQTAAPTPRQFAEQAWSRAREEFFRDLAPQIDAGLAPPIIVVPKPPQAIPGGSAGPFLLAQTFVSKYADHQPLYRLERIFARQGVRFARSTTCDWCAQGAAFLEPLAKLIRDEVLRSFVIHTDDTPVEVRAARVQEKYKARFWTYYGDDQHRLVWFDFTRSRKRAGPDLVLKDFRGYLQADGYGGYDDYEGVELSDATPILKVACWVHARRKFRDAAKTEPQGASVGLAFIRRLYKIEREIDELLEPAAAELPLADWAKEVGRLRRERARPVLNEFRKWLDEMKPKLLPKSPLAKAIGYTLNQWEALQRYLEDGRLSLDNNKAEGALRGIALGRKNWLFCGSEEGGRTAAVFFTLIGSAVRNGFDPYHYLGCVLDELPLLGESPTPEQLRRYLPNVWKPLEP